MKKWASTTGWNQDKRLAVLIPSGKVPAYLQKPFPVSDTILTTIWKERSDLQKLYPEVAKGNLTGIKRWANTTGWNQDKRLASLIPSGKVPLYLQKPFPVSNAILTTIWKDRSDLQKAFPEVANGNFTKLQKWANKTGWNEDKRLAALIPHGKVPAYTKSIPTSPFPVSNSTLLLV